MVAGGLYGGRWCCCVRLCLRLGFLEGYCRSLSGCLGACVEPRCVWGRNSEGSGGFRWVFGPNVHFWGSWCRVGICVGGDLGMIVLSGTWLDLVGCDRNGIFLGGPSSGLCGGKKKSLSLCMCVRRAETLTV